MKHLRIASLLERRIQKGDYALTGIPAERDLADDIGTSRVTVRKALDELLRKGLLERAPNRRLVLTSKARTATSGLNIAFISPSIAPKSFSPDLQLWRAAVENVARSRGDRVRVVHYHHWDDPALSEAIRAFDGIFLVTSAEPIPKWTADLLTEANCVVALSEDLSHLEIPSIVLFPPRLIRSMTGRLQQLGHRRIDCLNVQGHNLITEARIGEWEHWRKRNAVDGVLVDVPCSFDDNIYEAGIELARQWIRRLDKETTAVFCVTLPAAMGVVRAACELDISIGDQLSVCTVDCEGIGKFLSPPIASFERPDPEKYMNACIDWFAGKGKRGTWQGPYLLEPDELEIFDGGSIGPPLERRRRPVKRRVS